MHLFDTRVLVRLETIDDSYYSVFYSSQKARDITKQIFISLLLFKLFPILL